MNRALHQVFSEHVSAPLKTNLSSVLNQIDVVCLMQLNTEYTIGGSMRLHNVEDNFNIPRVRSRIFIETLSLYLEAPSVKFFLFLSSYFAAYADFYSKAYLIRKQNFIRSYGKVLHNTQPQDADSVLESAAIQYEKYCNMRLVGSVENATTNQSLLQEIELFLPLTLCEEIIASAVSTLMFKQEQHSGEGVFISSTGGVDSFTIEPALTVNSVVREVGDYMKQKKNSLRNAVFGSVSNTGLYEVHPSFEPAFRERLYSKKYLDSSLVEIDDIIISLAYSKFTGLEKLSVEPGVKEFEIKVADNNRDLGLVFGWSNYTKPDIVVKSVRQRSLVSSLHVIKPGFVIIGINGKRLTNVKPFEAEVLAYSMKLPVVIRISSPDVSDFEVVEKFRYGSVVNFSCFEFFIAKIRVELALAIPQEEELNSITLLSYGIVVGIEHDVFGHKPTLMERLLEYSKISFSFSVAIIDVWATSPQGLLSLFCSPNKTHHSAMIDVAFSHPSLSLLDKYVLPKNALLEAFLQRLWRKNSMHGVCTKNLFVQSQFHARKIKPNRKPELNLMINFSELAVSVNKEVVLPFLNYFQSGPDTLSFCSDLLVDHYSSIWLKEVVRNIALFRLLNAEVYGKKFQVASTKESFHNSENGLKNTFSSLHCDIQCPKLTLKMHQSLLPYLFHDTATTQFLTLSFTELAVSSADNDKAGDRLVDLRLGYAKAQLKADVCIEDKGVNKDFGSSSERFLLKRIDSKLTWKTIEFIFFHNGCLKFVFSTADEMQVDWNVGTVNEVLSKEKLVLLMQMSDLFFWHFNYYLGDSKYKTYAFDSSGAKVRPRNNTIYQDTRSSPVLDERKGSSFEDEVVISISKNVVRKCLSVFISESAGSEDPLGSWMSRYDTASILYYVYIAIYKHYRAKISFERFCSVFPLQRIPTKNFSVKTIVSFFTSNLLGKSDGYRIAPFGRGFNVVRAYCENFLYFQAGNRGSSSGPVGAGRNCVASVPFSEQPASIIFSVRVSGSVLLAETLSIAFHDFRFQYLQTPNSYGLSYAFEDLHVHLNGEDVGSFQATNLFPSFRKFVFVGDDFRFGRGSDTECGIEGIFFSTLCTQTESKFYCKNPSQKMPDDTTTLERRRGQNNMHQDKRKSVKFISSENDTGRQAGFKPFSSANNRTSWDEDVALAMEGFLRNPLFALLSYTGSVDGRADSLKASSGNLKTVFTGAFVDSARLILKKSHLQQFENIRKWIKESIVERNHLLKASQIPSSYQLQIPYIGKVLKALVKFGNINIFLDLSDENVKVPLIEFTADLMVRCYAQENQEVGSGELLLKSLRLRQLGTTSSAPSRSLLDNVIVGLEWEHLVEQTREIVVSLSSNLIKFSLGTQSIRELILIFSVLATVMLVPVSQEIEEDEEAKLVSSVPTSSFVQWLFDDTLVLVSSLDQAALIVGYEHLLPDLCATSRDAVAIATLQSTVNFLNAKNRNLLRSSSTKIVVFLEANVKTAEVEITKLISRAFTDKMLLPVIFLRCEKIILRLEYGANLDSTARVMIKSCFLSQFYSRKRSVWQSIVERTEDCLLLMDYGRFSRRSYISLNIPNRINLVFSEDLFLLLNKLLTEKTLRANTVDTNGFQGAIEHGPESDYLLVNGLSDVIVIKDLYQIHVGGVPGILKLVLQDVWLLPTRKHLEKKEKWNCYVGFSPQGKHSGPEGNKLNQRRFSLQWHGKAGIVPLVFFSIKLSFDGFEADYIATMDVSPYTYASNTKSKQWIVLKTRKKGDEAVETPGLEALFNISFQPKYDKAVAVDREKPKKIYSKEAVYIDFSKQKNQHWVNEDLAVAELQNMVRNGTKVSRMIQFQTLGLELTGVINLQEEGSFVVSLFHNGERTSSKVLVVVGRKTTGGITILVKSPYLIRNYSKETLDLLMMPVTSTTKKMQEKKALLSEVSVRLCRVGQFTLHELLPHHRETMARSWRNPNQSTIDLYLLFHFWNTENILSYQIDFHRLFQDICRVKGFDRTELQQIKFYWTVERETNVGKWLFLEHREIDLSSILDGYNSFFWLKSTGECSSIRIFIIFDFVTFGTAPSSIFSSADTKELEGLSRRSLQIQFYKFTPALGLFSIYDVLRYLAMNSSGKVPTTRGLANVKNIGTGDALKQLAVASNLFFRGIGTAREKLKDQISFADLSQEVSPLGSVKSEPLLLSYTLPCSLCGYAKNYEKATCRLCGTKLKIKGRVALNEKTLPSNEVCFMKFLLENSSSRRYFQMDFPGLGGETMLNETLPGRDCWLKNTVILVKRIASSFFERCMVLLSIDGIYLLRYNSRISPPASSQKRVVQVSEETRANEVVFTEVHKFEFLPDTSLKLFAENKSIEFRRKGSSGTYNKLILQFENEISCRDWFEAVLLVKRFQERFTGPNRRLRVACFSLRLYPGQTRSLPVSLFQRQPKWMLFFRQVEARLHNKDFQLSALHLTEVDSSWGLAFPSFPTSLTESFLLTAGTNSLGLRDEEILSSQYTFLVSMKIKSFSFRGMGDAGFYKLNILPWLQLNNDLPYSVIFELLQDNTKAQHSYIVEAGKAVEVTNLGPGAVMRLRIPSLGYSWSRLISFEPATSTANTRYLEDNASMLLFNAESDNSKNYSVSLNRVTSSSEITVIQVTSPCWIYNYSDVNVLLREVVEFAQTNNKPREILVFGDNSFFELTEDDLQGGSKLPALFTSSQKSFQLAAVMGVQGTSVESRQVFLEDDELSSIKNKCAISTFSDPIQFTNGEQIDVNFIVDVEHGRIEKMLSIELRLQASAFDSRQKSRTPNLMLIIRSKYLLFQRVPNYFIGVAPNARELITHRDASQDHPSPMSRPFGALDVAFNQMVSLHFQSTTFFHRQEYFVLGATSFIDGSQAKVGISGKINLDFKSDETSIFLRDVGRRISLRVRVAFRHLGGSILLVVLPDETVFKGISLPYYTIRNDSSYSLEVQQKSENVLGRRTVLNVIVRPHQEIPWAMDIHCRVPEVRVRALITLQKALNLGLLDKKKHIKVVCQSGEEELLFSLDPTIHSANGIRSSAKYLTNFPLGDFSHGSNRIESYIPVSRFLVYNLNILGETTPLRPTKGVVRENDEMYSEISVENLSQKATRTLHFRLASSYVGTKVEPEQQRERQSVTAFKVSLRLFLTEIDSLDITKYFGVFYVGGKRRSCAIQLLESFDHSGGIHSDGEDLESQRNLSSVLPVVCIVELPRRPLNLKIELYRQITTLNNHQVKLIGEAKIDINEGIWKLGNEKQEWFTVNGKGWNSVTRDAENELKAQKRNLNSLVSKVPREFKFSTQSGPILGQKRPEMKKKLTESSLVSSPSLPSGKERSSSVATDKSQYGRMRRFKTFSNIKRGGLLRPRRLRSRSSGTFDKEIGFVTLRTSISRARLPKKIVVQCKFQIAEKFKNREHSMRKDLLFQLFCSSIGFSFVHARKRKEVVYFFMKSLEMNALSTFGTLDLSGYVKHLQVDDQTKTPRHKVVLASKTGGSFSNDQNLVGTNLSMCAVSFRVISHSNHPTLLLLDEVDISVTPLYLFFTESFLNEALEYIEASYSSGKDIIFRRLFFSNFMERKPKKLPMPLSSVLSMSSTSPLIYIAHLSIRNFALYAFVDLQGGRQISGDGVFSNTLVAYLPTLEVEPRGGLLLNFKGIEEDGLFLRMDDLYRRIRTHYVFQLIGNLHKILAGVKYFVNPLQLSRNLVQGFQLAVAQPVQELDSRNFVKFLMGLKNALVLTFTFLISNFADVLNGVSSGIISIYELMDVADSYDVFSMAFVTAFTAIRDVSGAIQKGTEDVSKEVSRFEEYFDRVREPREFRKNGSYLEYGGANVPREIQQERERIAAFKIKRWLRHIKQRRDYRRLFSSSGGNG
eukprot:snap_masked-scaffold_4-processed-gene-10.35-mRNA-1 protein AED:1.00 eAED:1.00 QI:0/0/0/0/1/1/5/0/3852